MLIFLVVQQVDSVKTKCEQTQDDETKFWNDAKKNRKNVIRFLLQKKKTNKKTETNQFDGLKME